MSLTTSLGRNNAYENAARERDAAEALVDSILDGTYQEHPGYELPWADHAFQQALLKALGTAAHWKRSHDSLSHLGTVLRGDK
jgi:hypothetical protein